MKKLTQRLGARVAGALTRKQLKRLFRPLPQAAMAATVFLFGKMVYEGAFDPLALLLAVLAVFVLQVLLYDNDE
ncbi:hypothetical protein [Thioalkalivibrio sp. ALMg11]|uniref:hypothetical protein n=1 Tax=Thioalkalivibrio sp. ALMg11 TaxID=1158165 RepID=UPI00036016DF|nr:hypothetical protein [Thioalkalivibrio sp. ALMg11]